VSRIESGEADYTADVLRESTFARGGPLDVRYGQGGAGAPGKPRLVQTPQLGVHFLQFNTSRGPFTDARLRRAVNYAIDRRALAAAAGELPNAAYLPPGLPGASRTPVYPLEPNLARARALAQGFRGKVVLYSCRRPDCTTAARIVRANLAPLGITVRIVQLEDQWTAAQKPGAAYDMLLLTWFFDWPDPSDVLNVLLSPDGFRPDWAPRPLAIPESYRHALQRASLLRGPARAAAYARLQTRLERNVAPFAAFATPVLPEFFSARIGCVVEQPIVGAADIGTLCIEEH
jgi:ABC-type transport system substrate-binding protein